MREREFSALVFPLRDVNEEMHFEQRHLLQSVLPRCVVALIRMRTSGYSEVYFAMPYILCDYNLDN